jgi:hypothetical protein
MAQTQIAEWWEVRWIKPNEPVHTLDSGWPSDGIRPKGVFALSQEAHEFKDRMCNRYLKVIHVVRYGRV